MVATYFRFGFPTGCSRVDFAIGRLWPRCINAELSPVGHECGKPAAFIGTKLAAGAQACFCADCKERGHEERGFGEWHALEPAAHGS